MTSRTIILLFCMKSVLSKQKDKEKEKDKEINETHWKPMNRISIIFHLCVSFFLFSLSSVGAVVRSMLVRIQPGTTFWWRNG